MVPHGAPGRHRLSSRLGKLSDPGSYKICTETADYNSRLTPGIALAGHAIIYKYSTSIGACTCTTFVHYITSEQFSRAGLPSSYATDRTAYSSGQYQRKE